MQIITIETSVNLKTTIKLRASENSSLLILIFVLSMEKTGLNQMSGRYGIISLIIKNFRFLMTSRNLLQFNCDNEIQM